MELTRGTKLARFTDQEWKAISDIFSSSRAVRRRVNSRRQQVEEHLARYLRHRESLWTSLKTKRSVKKIDNYATKLRTELEALLIDPAFFSAGRPLGLTSDPVQIIRPLLKNLDWLQHDMRSAEGRLSMGPGRKKLPVDFLVMNLNWIQNTVTNDNVIRSNKRRSDKALGSAFIHMCCQKVGLSKGQIDRALRRNISYFHKSLGDGLDVSNHPFRTRKQYSASKRARPKKKKM
jgi:hypothetical protein